MDGHLLPNLWDWAAAEQNLRRGTELSPSNALAEIRYAIYLTGRSRIDDAIAHMRRAVELDRHHFSQTDTWEPRSISADTTTKRCRPLPAPLKLRPTESIWFKAGW